MLLRLGLELADRIAWALPAPVAYGIADLVGDLRYRLSPRPRRLVSENLRRVCAATGRPTRGGAFQRLVRSAFRNHARYYLELLRTPHYPSARIDDYVEFPGYDRYDALLRAGPTLLVSSHLGNFEPFGVFIGAQGHRPLCPIEEVEPPELFAFLSARRGGGLVDLVPLRRASRALAARLRAGGIVGIIGERDLSGDGQAVTMFGHPTTVPSGGAALAVRYRTTLLMGRCLRIGPDRFRVEGELVDVPNTGDRHRDVATLVERMVGRFERDIGDAPEQWWGAFQPVWPDVAEPAPGAAR